MAGAEGIRFYVLGPPKSNDYIKKEEVKGEGYEKREKKSTLDMAFLNLFDSDHFTKRDLMPFDDTYVLDEKEKSPIKDVYKADPWRTIDSDWLFSAGNLALRHETCINNTSLIRKTKGKLFFLGDRKKILKNIKTSRVTISKANMDRLEKLNQPFDGQIFID